jgi:hypothetical protein
VADLFADTLFPILLNNELTSSKVGNQANPISADCGTISVKYRMESDPDHFLVR